MVERTCVICRKKLDKQKLFRFANKGNDLVYDKEQKIQSRGFYICDSKICLERLSKHKKYNIPIEQLFLVSKEVKNREKDFLNSLKMMKNSNYLTFGIKMVNEQFGKIKLLIIAEDVNKKNLNKLIMRCRESEIDFIISGTKRELGTIFNKDEINVIGIKNSQVAKGLL